MINLRNGDRLPTVVLIQSMLNADPASTERLDVDGIFGSRTRSQVSAFQQRNFMANSGIVERLTWVRLNTIFQNRYQIRDIVDLSDEPILSIARNELVEEGQDPITMRNTSGGVYRIVPELRNTGISHQNLFILRLQGHGNSGSIAVSYGTGCHVYYGMIDRPFNNDWADCGRQRDSATESQLEAVDVVTSRSGLSSSILQLADVRKALAPLRNMFGPFGVLELHGCQVGRGNHGQQFLQDLSDFLGVPAVASTISQYAEQPIRLRGRLVVTYPNGHSARSWANARPMIWGL